ncbi:hypothetical protein [Bradyrhizobium sp. USDA 4504]
MKADGTELIRHDPFDVAATRDADDENDVIVAGMMSEFDAEVNKLRGCTLKDFIKIELISAINCFTPLTARIMGRMEDTLGELVESFKVTLRAFSGTRDRSWCKVPAHQARARQSVCHALPTSADQGVS